MKTIRRIIAAFTQEPEWYRKAVEPIVWEETLPEVPVNQVDSRFQCGVPDCNSGVVSIRGDRYTVVDCEEHNALTHWFTKEPTRGEQKIIRVQDSWRQHGTSTNKR